MRGMANTDLTPREEQVVFLAGQGLTDIEIGARLGIRPNTVAGYWLRMRLKLGAASRTAVAAIYAEEKAREATVERESLRAEIALRKRAERALREAHAELEDRVKARTAELEESNRKLRAEVAERERLQKELMESRDSLVASEAKYRSVFEESFDGLFITSPRGRVLDMNRKGMAILGYETMEEVLRLDIAGDVYDDPAVRSKLLSLIDKKGDGAYQIVAKKKSGERIVLEISLTAERAHDGEIVSYRGIMRDVTLQKQAESVNRP